MWPQIRSCPSSMTSQITLVCASTATIRRKRENACYAEPAALHALHTDKLEHQLGSRGDQAKSVSLNLAGRKSKRRKHTLLPLRTVHLLGRLLQLRERVWACLRLREVLKVSCTQGEIAKKRRKTGAVRFSETPEECLSYMRNAERGGGMVTSQ